DSFELEKSHLVFGSEKRFLSHQSVQNVSFGSPPDVPVQRDTWVEAGWLFRGGGEQSSKANLKLSESANEDILIIYYQLDFATRVQVEAEVIKQLESKRRLSSKSEAQDNDISLL
nr:Clp protease adapter protein ClpF, chloroplastic [Tanacetum cinerariifolium]